MSPFNKLTFKKLLVLLLIGLIISCKNNSDSKLKVIEKSESLTKELDKIHKEGHINGFSVAIVDQNGTLYQKGFGYADVKTKKLYSENTIQNVASISKTFIGIALLKAQELGKLDLDDPINNYLPFEVRNSYFPEKEITIRHLATHTSTIVDTKFYGEKSYILKENIDVNQLPEGIYVKLNKPESKTSMESFLNKILSEQGELYRQDGFLNKMPGEQFEYSNIGATLAAIVLENATGETFINFTSKHILNPLKMIATGWSFKDVIFSNHSKLYLNSNTEIPFYSLITFPDGGLITSVNDLSKYLTELINGFNGDGSILTKNSYTELFTKQLKDHNFSNQSGENEGIFVSFSSDGLIGHSGGDPGVATHMFYNPKTNIGKILFVNTELDSKGKNDYNAILNKLKEYK